MMKMEDERKDLHHESGRSARMRHRGRGKSWSFEHSFLGKWDWHERRSCGEREATIMVTGRCQAQAGWRQKGRGE